MASLVRAGLLGKQGFQRAVVNQANVGLSSIWLHFDFHPVLENHTDLLRIMGKLARVVEFRFLWNLCFPTTCVALWMEEFPSFYFGSPYQIVRVAWMCVVVAKHTHHHQLQERRHYNFAVVFRVLRGWGHYKFTSLSYICKWVVDTLHETFSLRCGLIRIRFGSSFGVATKE